MKFGLIALLDCLFAIVTWRSCLGSDRSDATGQVSAEPSNPRRASAFPKSSAPLDRVQGDNHDAPEGIAGKLNRLYQSYLSSPNSGYSNVLETIIPLTIEDPAASDLFKDACIFVAMRSGIASHIADAEADLQRTREWLIHNNPIPEAQSNALQRFEQSRPRTVENLLQTDEAFTTMFAERFTHRHGIDGKLAVELLSGLTLENPGPELWIRCDESVSPYPKHHPDPTHPGPREVLPFFRSQAPPGPSD